MDVYGAEDDDNDRGFVSLYSNFTHTQGTAQAVRLQQWRQNYFSLVIWRGVKQYFTVVGQAQFVCFTPWQQYSRPIMAVT